MPSNEEIMKWVEETRGKITFKEWKTQDLRKSDEQARRSEEEARKRDKAFSERVNKLVFANFVPERDGEMVPWDDVLIPDLGLKQGGKKIGKVTIRDGILASDIASDSNVLDGSPRFKGDVVSKETKVTPPPFKSMSDEQLLQVLFKNLPNKTFFLEEQRGNSKMGNVHYGLTGILLKRMK